MVLGTFRPLQGIPFRDPLFPPRPIKIQLIRKGGLIEFIWNETNRLRESWNLTCLCFFTKNRSAKPAFKNLIQQKKPVVFTKNLGGLVLKA